MLAALLLSGGAVPTLAAGMTTHALMADLGRQALADGALKSLLAQQRGALLAGAINPDGGYATGALFDGDREMAERAHWEDFNDAFIAHLRAIGCDAQLRAALAAGTGDAALAAVPARCARLVAFAFGNAAHGLGDEIWDSLFETVVRERDLDAAKASPLHSAGPHCSVFDAVRDPQALRSALARGDDAAAAKALDLAATLSIEMAMDMVAIVDQHLWDDDVPLLVFPPVEDLVAAHALNRPELGIGAAQVQRGFMIAKAGLALERVAALPMAPLVRSAMPWASANYYLNSGGVVDTAQAIAALYEHLWAKLLGEPLPIAVAGVHPRNGEAGVPYRAGAAEGYIRAFTTQSAPESAVERAGVICLFDEDGRRVEGETISGLYDPDWGHVINFTPAADLAPDQRYTVVVTDRLVDQLGRVPRSAYAWSFRTAAATPAARRR
ncbi:Ig-like domain-containing protein [Solimonas variicoloris]|uniref:Ig-like domain-containing protein n=1 Tax=Solimonas variicoloris TaxID=254408 RepID=UPI0003690C4E|nr:Ig-like domain-containing protein [Solimonas variicoloris]